MDYTKYLEKGYTVLPVEGKAPKLTDWQKLTVDTITDEMINSWESNKRWTGMGVLLRDGLTCIDIDTDDPELLYKIESVITPSPVKRFGKKGFCAFYQMVESPEKTTQIISHGGMELGAIYWSGSGRQIVLPPSIHPDTNEKYKWITIDTLLDFEIIDLPILPVDTFNKVIKMLGSNTIAEYNNNVPKHDQVSGFDASLGRNNRLFSALGEIMARKDKEIDLDYITEHLMTIDRVMHRGREYFKDRKDMTSVGVSFSDDTKLNAYSWVTKSIARIQRKMKDSGVEVKTVPMARENIDGDIVWPERPVDVSVAFEANKGFNYELIPAVCRGLVMDVAEALNVPPLQVFCTYLYGIGAVLQGKIRIFPAGVNSGWYERPNINVLLVAPSGFRKSPIKRSVLFPLSEIQEKLMGVKPDEKALRRINMMNGTIEDLEKKYKKAGMDNADEATLEELEERIDEATKKRNEYLKTLGPLPKTVMFSTGTVQALHQTLIKNPVEGVWMIYEEIKDLFLQFDKLGNEGMRQLVMDVMDGNTQGRTHVIKNESSHLRNPLGSVFGCIQDDLLLDDCVRPINKGRGAMNDGFWQRFMFCTTNDIWQSREVRQDLDLSKHGAAFDKMRFGWQTDPADIFLNYDADTQDRFRQLKYEIETEKILLAKSKSKITGFIAKQESQLIKVAYILEFLKSPAGYRPNKISVESLDQSYELLGYLRDNIKKLFKFDLESDVASTAMAVLAEIKAERINHGMLIGQAKTVLGFKIDTAKYTEALQLLETYGHISIENDGRSSRILVHPRYR